MGRRARLEAALEERPAEDETPRRDPSTWSRRRRLLHASQWRSIEVEGVRDYVRKIERAIAHGELTKRMRGRP